MDPLTDVLQDLRLKRSSYYHSDLSAPWGLALEAIHGPSFHIVVMGRSFLRIEAQCIPLQTGDLVLLPHGVAHELASDPEGPAVPCAALPSQRVGDRLGYSSEAAFSRAFKRHLAVPPGVIRRGDGLQIHESGQPLPTRPARISTSKR